MNVYDAEEVEAEVQRLLELCETLERENARLLCVIMDAKELLDQAAKRIKEITEYI